MTDLVGSVGARQIASARAKLADAARNAEWSRRMSHGREDPYIVARDRDALLDAAQEMLAVIDEHIGPRCPSILPGTEVWRCLWREGHDGRHGDNIVSWSD